MCDIVAGFTALSCVASIVHMLKLKGVAVDKTMPLRRRVPGPHHYHYSQEMARCLRTTSSFLADEQVYGLRIRFRIPTNRYGPENNVKRLPKYTSPNER